MMMLDLPTRFVSLVGISFLTAFSVSFSSSAMAQDRSAQAYLNAALSTDGDEVGHAVAMDQNTIFAGAPGYIGSGSGQGQVFTWRLDGQAAWVAGSAIAPPNPQDVEFGRSLALGANTLVVGAPASSTTRANTGAVEIFARSSSQRWNPVARLAPADAQPGDEFGHAVALDGNTLVVGARGESSRGPSAGAAYIFERASPSQSWTQVAKLMAPNAQGQDFFGTAVAIDGRRIVVGAPGQDGLKPPGAPIPATDAGRVYVYEKQNNAWTLDKELVIADPGPSDFLGTSVQVLGDTVVAGAPGVDTLSPGQTPPFVANTGAVYEYRKSNGRWRQRQVLVAPEKRTDEALGSALAMDQGRLLVGSTYRPFGDAETGTALFWMRDNEESTWALGGALKPNRPDETWGHGQSLFLYQDQALVGAPFAPSFGQDYRESGSVSVYQIPGSVPAPVLPAPLQWLTLSLLTGCLYRGRKS